MKKTETIKIMGMLAAAYPNAKVVTEAQVEVWHECLQDLDTQQTLTATRKHIMESQYYPTIHDIREQIAKINMRTLEPGEAWGQVQKAIKHYGYYRELEALASMDPRAAEAARAIGWQQICHTPSDSLGVLRSQYFKIYDGLSKRDYTKALLPRGMQTDIKAIATQYLEGMTE